MPSKESLAHLRATAGHFTKDEIVGCGSFISESGNRLIFMAMGANERTATCLASCLSFGVGIVAEEKYRQLSKKKDG